MLNGVTWISLRGKEDGDIIALFSFRGILIFFFTWIEKFQDQNGFESFFHNYFHYQTGFEDSDWSLSFQTSTARNISVPFEPTHCTMVKQTLYLFSYLLFFPDVYHSIASDVVDKARICNIVKFLLSEQESFYILLWEFQDEKQRIITLRSRKRNCLYTFIIIG